MITKPFNSSGLRTLVATVSILVMAGCATNSADKIALDSGEAQKDQSRSAKKKDNAPFRGRWWSYYERGRGYLDEESFVKAEEDIRTALRKRTRDQRWARTYGLHFVREYFPNRELGIVLYSQDKYEQALPYLELSNRQFPSARAAYYLDLTRVELFSSSDASDPVVTFSAHRNSDRLSDQTITLLAQATDDTYVRTVRINGAPYPIQVSSPVVDIEAQIPLNAGANSIVVTVTDISGKEKSFALNVTADLEGPAVSIDRPISLPGTITGVVSDPALVKRIEIAGVRIEFSSTVSETTTFSIELTREHLDRIPPGGKLTFKAEDTKGNTTTGLVELQAEGATIAFGVPPKGIVFASTPTKMDLGNGLVAEVGDGKITSITVAVSEPTLTVPVIDVTNAHDTQKYRLDEIILGMVIRSANTIDSVVINGIPFEQLMPDRKEVSISRRIPLPESVNPVIIQVVDSAGVSATRKLELERVFTGIDFPGNRLNLAILGSLYSGIDSGLDEEAAYITRRLESELQRQNRFILTSPEIIQEVLQERELSALLGDKNARQEVSNELEVAEVLVVGNVHRSFDSIEVVLEAIDAASSEVIGYADVAGPNGSSEDLERESLDTLARDLALRLRQLFPVADGKVLRAQNNRKIQTDLNRTHGVAKRIKCIVYRRSPEEFHPTTGESLGYTTEIIANGYLSAVKKDRSVISILKDGVRTETPIEETDLVVTK
ncbi:hypothetical protein JYT90_00080 [bacterium AH-315-P07]|nr:hypothetical protein [bacterium AH-315-P07]